MGYTGVKLRLSSSRAMTKWSLISIVCSNGVLKNKTVYTNGLKAHGSHGPFTDFFRLSVARQALPFYQRVHITYLHFQLTITAPPHGATRRNIDLAFSFPYYHPDHVLLSGNDALQWFAPAISTAGYL